LKIRPKRNHFLQLRTIWRKRRKKNSRLDKERFQPNKTKTTEVWAVGIAAFALAVSFFSWWDVRKQVNLFGGQIRSYVQVSDVKLVEPITEASFIKLQLKMKNYGQTAAVNVHSEMDYDVGVPDFDGKGNSATRREIGSMGPGLERTATLTSNRINRREWPTPSSNRYQTIYFYGTVWYTDDTTHEKRKEDWCYCLPLKKDSDLTKTELEPCGTLTYTSKELH
jgi:hypothetical protein